MRVWATLPEKRVKHEPISARAFQQLQADVKAKDKAVAELSELNKIVPYVFEISVKIAVDSSRLISKIFLFPKFLCASFSFLFMHFQTR